MQNNTLSIYQSTLEIDNVQESDAKNYTCAGEYIISNDNSTFFTMKEIRHYELLVHGIYDILIINIFFIMLNLL